MTTHERAKAYENVCQKVKDFFEGKQKMYNDVKQTLEYLFPELVESEDEKIRKDIISFLKANKDFPEDWIAWLEKQGEQKSADSYCQENCKGFQETGKCFADGKCKAKRDAEQNLAWSEEDEMMFTSTINSLKLTNGACDMKIDWLKSIKNRLQS